MVPGDLWTDIDSRLQERFMLIPKKAFAGLWVVTVDDSLQLLLGREKLIFWQISEKYLWKIYLAWGYDDDDQLFLRYGWAMKSFWLYFQPRHCQRSFPVRIFDTLWARFESVQKSEFRFSWMKLCSSDNNKTTARQSYSHTVIGII